VGYVDPVMTSWAVSLLLLACGAHTSAVGRGEPDALRVVADEHAPIGVTVRSLPEGLLVEGLATGGGAEAAGVGVGDLIVTVADIEVRKAPRAARDALGGPVGSSVGLTLRRAEGGGFEVVEVERGWPDAPALDALPASVRALRKALTERGRRAVRRAVREAITDDFGGLRPSDGVGYGLVTAWRRRPALALAAAELLADAKLGDPLLDRRLGTLFLEDERWEDAARSLALADAVRPPDVWEPTGSWRGDAGGGGAVRQGLAQSMWALGERDVAIDIVRTLLASHDDPGIAATVGMAPWRQPETWSAALPGVDDFDLDLLDGGRFRLSEHRGEVVILSFFATWCAPCRKELPELARTAAERADQGVIVVGVSLDFDQDANALPGFVDRLGLSFPIAHAPALGQRFGVEGIPALRVLDRQGVLVHEASGYTRRGLDELEEVLDGLSASDSLAQSALGDAWSREDARLEGFLSLPGTLDVVLTDRDLAISRAGGPPVAMAGDGTATPPRADGPGGGDLVAWLGGPVSAASGQHAVRATTTSGRSRWLLTTAAPITALAADEVHAWVGTEAGALVLDRLGRVLWRVEGSVKDLAPDGAGGAWLVDGALRRHIDAEGQVDAVVDAPGAALVDGEGRVASDEFADMLRGRFGPDGASRSAVARRDGTLVVLDGEGEPAMTWTLHDPPRLAAGDIDGDGQDELLVAVHGQGLATVSLSIP